MLEFSTTKCRPFDTTRSLSVKLVERDELKYGMIYFCTTVFKRNIGIDNNCCHVNVAELCNTNIHPPPNRHPHHQSQPTNCNITPTTTWTQLKTESYARETSSQALAILRISHRITQQYTDGAPSVPTPFRAHVLQKADKPWCNWNTQSSGNSSYSKRERMLVHPQQSHGAALSLHTALWCIAAFSIPLLPELHNW